MITAYLKQIARGRDGARSLDAAQAQDLLRQVFEGRVSEVQLGAFAIAMRIKGESPAELAGFVAASQDHIDPAIAAALHRIGRPLVWLPSYNGARKLPNLTPLLAALLARRGLGVIVHGFAGEPQRVASRAIFEALGWPVVARADQAAAIGTAQAGAQPVFVDLEALCPPLARLLQVRAQTGLRNPGHSVAKLLAPPGPGSLRVVNHTHPEYAGSLSQYLEDSRADALLLRGTEGEPVADSRRTPRMDAFVAGRRSDALSVPAQGGVLQRVPMLPAAIDAATTAGFIARALLEADAVPLPIQQQVGALASLAALVAAGSTAAPQPLAHAA